MKLAGGILVLSLAWCFLSGTAAQRQVSLLPDIRTACWTVGGVAINLEYDHAFLQKWGSPPGQLPANVSFAGRVTLHSSNAFDVKFKDFQVKVVGYGQSTPLTPVGGNANCGGATAIPAHPIGAAGGVYQTSTGALVRPVGTVSCYFNVPLPANAVRGYDLYVSMNVLPAQGVPGGVCNVWLRKGATGYGYFRYVPMAAPPPSTVVIPGPPAISVPPEKQVAAAGVPAKPAAAPAAAAAPMMTTVQAAMVQAAVPAPVAVVPDAAAGAAVITDAASMPTLVNVQSGRRLQ